LQKKQIKSIIKTVKGNATPQPSKNAVKKLAPLMKAQIVQKKIALGQAKQAAKNANLNKKIALKIVKKNPNDPKLVAKAEQAVKNAIALKSKVQSAKKQVKSLIKIAKKTPAKKIPAALTSF